MTSYASERAARRLADRITREEMGRRASARVPDEHTYAQ
jgi:hypothetical protein